MSNLTVRIVFALFVAVALSACDESSPTGPSASAHPSGAGTTASDSAGTTVGALKKGGNKPPREPPPPAYNYLATGDVMMAGAAGGSGGGVNIRATTVRFSDGFIDQFDVDPGDGKGATCFGDLPHEVTGGLMNPDANFPGAVASVQIYFTATNTGGVDVRYQLSGWVELISGTFPPAALQTAMTKWMPDGTTRMGAESRLKKGRNATTVCDSDEVNVSNQTFIEVIGL